MKRSSNLLIWIVLLALAFRIIGADHSFPFVFHPDEPTTVRSALGVRFDPNPKHFDWPHLYIYLNFVLYMGFSLMRNLAEEQGLKTVISNIFPLVWNDTLIFYLLTRIVTAVFGALTVIPVYKATKEFINEKAAVFAALGFALLPIHVWYSHYTMPDVPTVFFLAWGMYFALKILKMPTFSNYMLAGFFIGLAASTKYNGGLSIVSIPLIYLLYHFKNENRESILDIKSILKGISAGVASLIGFVIGTPYAVMDFDTFMRNNGPKGAMWQFTNVGSRDLPSHIYSFFVNIFDTIGSDSGYVPLAGLLFCIAFLGYNIWKKHFDLTFKFVTFAVVMSLFLIYYISGFEKNRSHYYLIIYPYLALCFGVFLSKITDLLMRKNLYAVSVLFVTAAILPMFYFSAINTWIFSHKDTRVELYDWLKSNLKPTDNIVYDANIIKEPIDMTDIPSARGFIKIRRFTQGYLVVTDEDFDSLAKNAPGNVPITFGTFKEVLFLDDKLRHGPQIKVIYFAQ